MNVEWNVSRQQNAKMKMYGNMNRIVGENSSSSERISNLARWKKKHCHSKMKNIEAVKKANS